MKNGMPNNPFKEMGADIDTGMKNNLIYVLVPTTKERRPRLQKALAALQENKHPHVVCIYENDGLGIVQAIHKMLEGINGLVTIVNDDMVVAPDHLEVLYNAFIKAFPDGKGAAQSYDFNFNGEIMGDPLCHSDLYKKYWYKGYIHNFIDNEFTGALKAAGIPTIYVPEAKKDHEHFIKDRGLMDNTYSKVAKFFDQDKKLFEERQKNNFQPSNDYKSSL